MNNTGNDYLEMEVLTAIPQKLQLMLIEGALRFANQARRHWQSGNDAAASEALIRAQEIVAEIIGNLNPHESPDLVQRIVYIYLFVNRSLIEASFERSETKLVDALRVLEVERDTWRLACRQAASGTIVPMSTGNENTTSIGQSFVA